MDVRSRMLMLMELANMASSYCWCVFSMRIFTQFTCIFNTYKWFIEIKIVELLFGILYSHNSSLSERMLVVSNGIFAIALMSTQRIANYRKLFNAYICNKWSINYFCCWWWLWRIIIIKLLIFHLVPSEFNEKSFDLKFRIMINCNRNISNRCAQYFIHQ